MSTFHRLFLAIILTACFIISGCTAPRYNSSSDSSSGGSGGDLRMNGVSGAGTMLGFLSLFAGCPRRATDDAILTRYVDDSDLENASTPKKVRTLFFFHHSRDLADGVVFNEGPHGETVISLGCDTLVPTWVRVMESREASRDRTGYRNEVTEVDNDAFAYDLSSEAEEVDIVYQDGHCVRRVVLNMDDGDLSIKDNRTVDVRK